MKTIVKMLKTQNMTIHMEYIQQNKHATKHGDFTGYYPGGKRAITGSYIYGKPNGKWSRWYENGQMASVHHYMLGMLHGDYIQFFESGDQARKGKYLKGKPEGEHLIYFKKNRIEKRFIYKRGKIRRAEFLIKTRLSILDYVEGVLLLNGDEYKYKKVCLLTDTGELICKTPAQIIEDLSTMVDPDFIHDILDYFDRLFEDLALNNDKEILVGCAGGVLAVPTDQSGAPTVPQIDNPNLNRAPMTQTEIDSIFTACRDASRGAMGLDSSVPNFNNQRDNFVQDTVAGITAQVSNCRESSNDSIASGPGLIGRCMANPLCTEIFGGIIAGGGSFRRRKYCCEKGC